MNVALYLQGPETRVCLRNMAAFLAPVPEAPVDKNREAALTKIKVGSAGQRDRMQLKTRHPGPDEPHFQPDFGAFVLLAANFGHGPGAFRINIVKTAIRKRFS